MCRTTTLHRENVPSPEQLRVGWNPERLRLPFYHINHLRNLIALCRYV